VKPSFILKPCFFASSKDSQDPDSFIQRDHAEFLVYKHEKSQDWKYKKIRDAWQKPLEKKRLRRERLALVKKVILFYFICNCC
jgi:hypothetical protein